MFHIFGAFLLLSGSVSIAILQVTATRRERPSEVALFFNLARIAEVAIIAGSVVTFAFGLWLTHYHGDFGEGWVWAAIVLLVAAAALGGVGGSRYKHARVEAQSLAGAGDKPTPELERLKSDRTAFVLSYTSGFVVLAVLLLMIWKPGD